MTNDHTVPPFEELTRPMHTAATQTRQVRALLTAANVDMTGLTVQTHAVRSGPDGVELATTVSGFTKPLTGDETATAHADRMRAQLVETLRETFSAVDSNYGWVSVTTTGAR